MASSSLLLAAAAVLLLLLLSATPTHAKLSGNACKATSSPELCQPLVAGAKSKNDLAVAAIKLTVTELKAGIDTADNLKAGVKDAVLAAYFDNCKSMYTSALEGLESAQDLITGSGDNFDIKSALTAADASISGCRDDWSTGPFQLMDYPGLDQADAHIKKLTVMTFDLGKNLKGAKN